MFSGFNYGVIVEDSLVAIGLDFYLGKNSVFYQRLGDPEYLRFQKQARFITPNILEAWYDSFFSFTNKRTNFLSELIYKDIICNYQKSQIYRHLKKSFMIINFRFEFLTPTHKFNHLFCNNKSWF